MVLPEVETRPEPERTALAGIVALLEAEPIELEAELGAPVVLTTHDPGTGARFLLNGEVDGALLWLDREERVLRGQGAGAASLLSTLNALRTLSFTERDVLVEEVCRDLTEVVDRITYEIAHTYPAFAMRGLDWEAISARHAPRVLRAGDPLPFLQEWLAELEDMHTFIRPVPAPIPSPYHLAVAGDVAVFRDIPEGTPAWVVGVRPGDTLLNVDVASWWRRTGAAPYARALMAGYRLLSAPEGTRRKLRARSPEGVIRTWHETWRGRPPEPLVRWERRPSGASFLRIAAFRRDPGIDALLDAAFHDLRDVAHLIVDLRGNVGGSLEAARAFRNRFLRERTLLGSIRFSIGHGRLSRPQQLFGEPAANPFAGRVTFLTDALTYSAAEDALLGLQGLSHVRVVGQPSGGGSGRPRSIRLRPNLLLTISTALTYDRAGYCIEGTGIPVDHVLLDASMGTEAAVRAAESIPWPAAIPASLSGGSSPTVLTAR